MRTSRPELARLLGMSGPGALNRGMFKMANGPFQNDLLLFHDPEANPYGDVVTEDAIHYVGQGRTGDQELRSFNRYLRDHLPEGITVHFFNKAPDGDGLVYEGEVICEDVERVYRPDEGRSVLVFTLNRVDPSVTFEQPTQDYYRLAKEQMLGFAGEPRFVDRDVRMVKVQRKIRNVAFRDVVVAAYDQQCAVCGDVIAIGGLIEIDAAHIVGVAERGADDPRNGLSLCVRHHWAFDRGVFVVRDDLTVQSLLPSEDPHGEILEGADLIVPDEVRLQPHPWYLGHHREKWLRPSALG